MAKKVLTKRKQIDKSKAQMFGIIVAASFISVGCLVAAQRFFSQANYLNKVAGIKEEAVKQLKQDKDMVSSLQSKYKDFISQNPNRLGGSPSGTSPRDGDNGKLVLDALPSAYDFPALATSLEDIFGKYKINSINGTDDSLAIEGGGDDSQTVAPVTTGAGAVEIPFSVSLTATYAQFQEMIGVLDASIRPMHILNLSLSGKNDELQIDIAGKTYYKPETGLKIDYKEIK